MRVLLKQSKINITQGMVNVVSLEKLPMVYYEDTSTNPVKIYKDKNSLNLQPKYEDANITVDIANLRCSLITLGFGAINICAVGKLRSGDMVDIGAIKIEVKKEHIGELYMKVCSGAIIADENLVKINRIEPNGFEARFNGMAPFQKTVLLVNTGAILCKIE